MKTFEEALRVSVRTSTSLEQRELVKTELRETQQRYAELIDEARTNPTVAKRVVAWAVEIASANDPTALLDILFTAFACGLATGIEMEKAEDTIQRAHEPQSQALPDVEKSANEKENTA